MEPNLKKNYIYRVFYEVLIVVSPFITAPYIARVLGADGIGDYNFTHSILTYFTLVGGLGTTKYGSREISRARDDKYKVSKLFWEIELMTVFTCGAALIGWVGVIIFSSRYRLFYIALTPFILGAMLDIHWLFTGLERVGTMVLRNSIVRITFIIMVFVFVKEKDDIIIYTIINSMASLLSNLSMWVLLPKMLVKVNFRELTFKKHFRETMVYFIPAAASAIYTVLDKTLIGVITQNSYQNGYYAQAAKIIKIVKIIVFSSVNAVMGARMSYLFSKDRLEEVKQRLARSLDFIYLLAFGGMFGVTAIAPVFVPVFFGEGYDPVVQLIYLMAPLVLIVGTVNCLGGQYYIPSGQRKRSAKVIIASSGINLCLNLMFIPKFGAAGATVATIISESFTMTMYIRMSAGFVKWKQLAAFSYKRLFAGALMLVFVRYLGPLPISSHLVLVLLQIIFGALFYGALLLIMKDSMMKDLLKMVLGFFERAYKKIFRKK